VTQNERNEQNYEHSIELLSFLSRNELEDVESYIDANLN
jgi:hypothetical protein